LWAALTYARRYALFTLVGQACAFESEEGNDRVMAEVASYSIRNAMSG
jgi:hypothetical protein